MPDMSGKTRPPWSDEQATAWLSWLARGMQSQGQTVFLIEQLQPSWLESRRALLAYGLASRYFGSLVVGLAFGVFGLRRGAALLVFGLFAAAIAGLGTGLIEFFRLRGGRMERRLERPGAFTTIVVLSAIFTLVGSLAAIIGCFAVGLPSWERPEQVVLVGLFGPLFGITWGLRAHRRTLTTDVHAVEIMSWSWGHAGKSFLKGCIFGLVAFNLLLMALPGSADVGSVLAVGGIIFFFVEIATVFAGLRMGTKETSVVPNQGIRLSIKNALGAGGAGPIVALVLVLFLLGLALALGLDDIWWAKLPAFIGLLGLSVGLLAALRYGGLAVLQHYLLRFILHHQSAMPWRCVRFLDYAAEELRFLQKVGGGYMFVHRCLLEHFAAMGEVAEPEVVDARPAVPSGRRRHQAVSSR